MHQRPTDKPLLTLGSKRLARAKETDTQHSVYGADEASILAHSRHDPQAAWQKNLYRVPFFTSSGEKAKVVGDYMKGDSLRFEVKNKLGNTYAVLKRTQLDNGEPIWMIPEHASIQGGATLLCELDHEEVEAAIEELRDDLDEMDRPPAGIDKHIWNFRLAKTNELLDMIEGALPALDPAKDKILGYKVNDEIKGMLVLENKSPPSIYAFVTHPDPSIRGRRTRTHGTGPARIENRNERQRCVTASCTELGGQRHLRALGIQSRPARPERQAHDKRRLKAKV